MENIPGLDPYQIKIAQERVDQLLYERNVILKTAKSIELQAKQIASTWGLNANSSNGCNPNQLRWDF